MNKGGFFRAIGWMVFVTMLLLAGLAAAEVPLTMGYFPDASFRSYLAEKWDTDQDGTLSDSEIEAITEIAVGSLNEWPDVASLQGIQYLPAVRKLSVKTFFTDNVILEEIDLSRNTALEEVEIIRTNISALYTGSLTKLKSLKVINNPKLTGLDLQKNKRLEKLATAYASDDEAMTEDNGKVITILISDKNSLTSAVIGDDIVRYPSYYFQLKSTGKAVYIKPVKRTLTKLTIPAKVEFAGKSYPIASIADEACKDMTKLKTLAIGSKVESIGMDAFSGCVKLKTVSLGSKVKTIGDNAFAGCTALTTVSGGKNVTTIGLSAFAGDKKLSKFAPGSKVSRIDGYAFQKCSALKKLSFGSKLEVIGEKAFDGCKNLKELVLNSEVLFKWDEKLMQGGTTVQTNAFYGICSKVTVKIPKKSFRVATLFLRDAGSGLAFPSTGMIQEI